MPRIPRVIVPGLPHHVTQRGNGRRRTFLNEADRRVYLDLLRAQARRHGLSMWAWCLMDNHIHLLAVPDREDSLARVLGRTHAAYAQYWNAQRSGCGHLWQARFFSCPVEPEAAWVVAQYIETNPVRAGLVTAAEQWRWSSAGAHVTGRDAFNLLDLAPWSIDYDSSRWIRVLRTTVQDEAWQRRLEEATVRGRPVGTEAFIEQLERRLCRRLRPKPAGRPGKQRAEELTEDMVLRIGK